MGTYWTNPVRHPEDIGIGVLRRTITLAEFSAATSGLVPIGALEAGCQPLSVAVYVETAFNAATTNTLDVGTAGTAAGFAAAAATLVGATGYKSGLTSTLTGIPLSTDQIVYAKFAQTGTAATTGKVVIHMSFINKREGEGTAWPGN